MFDIKENREFKTLRISLTNTCNLGCLYCVDGTEKSSLNTNENKLTANQLFYITETLHHQLNLKTIRLTGGEPTLYKEIIPLVKQLNTLGVEIKMTTNAYVIEKLINDLVNAGLKSINISLDAITEATFNKVSKRKNLHQILQNIEACISAGLEVKLNTVIVKGINEHEIISIFNYAKTLNIPIRFLELMKMGHLYSKGYQDYFFSEENILNEIKSVHNFTKEVRNTSATANYYSLDSGYKFGIIANESSPFCNDCDRLRLDSSGNIYGCLSSNTPINIVSVYKNEKSMNESLELAMLQKQKLQFIGSSLSMMDIGG